jgi:hypothetical protein
VFTCNGSIGDRELTWSVRVEVYNRKSCFK